MTDQTPTADIFDTALNKVKNQIVQTCEATYPFLLTTEELNAAPGNVLEAYRNFHNALQNLNEVLAYAYRIPPGGK